MSEVNIFDPNYVWNTWVAKLQAQAEEVNASRQASYAGQCAEWVNNALVNRGRGIPLPPAPPIPMKMIVGMDGQTADVTWPELKPPVLPAENASPRTASIAAAGVPSQTDQVIAILKMMNEKLDKILAKGV